jgi:hypothetical protein
MQWGLLTVATGCLGISLYCRQQVVYSAPLLLVGICYTALFIAEATENYKRRIGFRDDNEMD